MTTGACPICGVSKKCIEEMLETGGWEDQCTAHAIIDSCHECTRWWNAHPYIGPTTRMYAMTVRSAS